MTTPLDEILGDEIQSAIWKAIDSLPERRRKIFLLARVQDLTYQEIAELLDIAPQTVANQMSAALTNLRRTLAPLLE